MMCSCSCHYDWAYNPYSSKFLSNYGCCSSCSLDPVKAGASNVKSLIWHAETEHDKFTATIRYTFRVRLNMDPVQEVTIGVKVAEEVAASSWFAAEEKALMHVAKELNTYWMTHPQSEWVRYRLSADQQEQIKKSSAWFEQNSPWPAQHASQNVSGDTVTGDLRKWLPGLSAWVNCPVNKEGLLKTLKTPCEYAGPVQQAIVHLNDHHRWDRHAVADWLETLDVDLSFGAEPPPPPPPLPEADRGQRLFIFATTAAQARNEAHRRRRGPSEWQYIPISNRTADQALRGHRGFQYCVVGGVSLPGHLAVTLAAAEARQVGDESTGHLTPYLDSLSKALMKTSEAYLQPAPQFNYKTILDEVIEWKEAFGAATEQQKHQVAAYLDAQMLDPWPGEPVFIDEPIKSAKEQALDAKKKTAHTHFTVNPTKKSPFKK